VDEVVDLGPGTTPIPLNLLLRQQFGYEHSFLGWVILILFCKSFQLTH